MTHHSLAKLLHSSAFVVLASVGFLVASPAQAGGPQKWYCDCMPPDRNKGECGCKGYQFEMKKWGTKEFQGRCPQRTTPSGKTIHPQFVDVGVSVSITCTYSFPIPTNYPYASMVCTNWNIAQKNTLTASIQCTAK